MWHDAIVDSMVREFEGAFLTMQEEITGIFSDEDLSDRQQVGPVFERFLFLKPSMLTSRMGCLAVRH